jgi:membrane protease YdiL (CAAX protease family)
MLIVGVCFGIVAAALAAQVLQIRLPHLKSADLRFYNHLIYCLFTQGMALVLTNTLLKQHDVRWADLLGLDDPRRRRAIALGSLVAIVVLPLILGVNYLCKQLFEALGEAKEQPAMLILQIADTIPRQIAFAFTTLIVAPITEEILFRGIAYKALRDRYSPALAVVLSSILFGLIHVNLVTLLPLTLFGAVLAVLYERTGNLLAPITAHSLFNAINLFYFLGTSR